MGCINTGNLVHSTSNRDKIMIELSSYKKPKRPLWIHNANSNKENYVLKDSMSLMYLSIDI